MLLQHIYVRHVLGSVLPCLPRKDNGKTKLSINYDATSMLPTPTNSKTAYYAGDHAYARHDGH